jgi:hypothetical protein
MSKKMVSYEFVNLTSKEFERLFSEVGGIALHMEENDPKYNAVMVPSPANHMKYYADTVDEEYFLKQARELTAARVFYAFVSTRVRFKQILETYLLGSEYFNCHAIIGSTRAMLELLANYYALNRNIARLSGTHKERGDSFEKFQARAIECELVLIKYSHGTRNEGIRQIREYLKPELSRLINPEEIDLDNMRSGNILNQINKLKGIDSSIDWKKEYETISGHLHPSSEQGSFHEFVSDEVDGAIEIVTKDVRTRGKAWDLTIKVMHSATKHMFQLMNSGGFPYGRGEFVDITKKCNLCGLGLAFRQAIERGVCRRCVDAKKACEYCGTKLTNKESKNRGTCFKCFNSGLKE